MRAVDDKIETIHVYVVRDQEKRPYTVLPLFCACLCLLGIAAVTLYSAQHPYYEHKRLTVPAIFLPLKVFRAEAPIIPTGVKTYPATYAVGMLTITNGSVISQEIPLGVIFISNSGVSVKTDQKVFVPAGSADGFGIATVPAHLLTSGINISTLSINQVVGTSLYVRNLSPFTGGRAAYSVIVQLPKDRQAAISLARAVVASQRARVQVFLASPCNERYFFPMSGNITLTWRCQFAIYHIPSSMHVLGAILAGRDFLVSVEFIPHPQQIWVK